MRRFCPPGSRTIALMGMVGLSILTACDDQDLETLERPGDLAAAPAFEGRFETRIADLLDGTSRTSHHLVDGPNEVEVVLPEGTQIARDSIVRAFGDVEDGVLALDDFEIVAGPPTPLIEADPFAPRRIAVVLTFWGGGGLPNGEARQDMFLSERSTNVFYEENSYGREKLAGEVFGPYEIDDPGGCNPSAIADAAQEAFKAKGHDPADYQQFMYHFPRTGGCGWAGLASVGSPQFPARDSWYNGSFGCVVRAQEIGHNYGMGHSHSYQCKNEEGENVPFSADCEFSEYGHPYDPMGSGCGHMNVVQKTFMGWIDGCNVVSATADGEFNLLPTELPCDGTQALRFPTFDDRYYYLEYRRPIGQFDGRAGYSGVLVQVASEVGGQGPRSYIIDVGDDGFLHAGDSYTDPEGAVTFTVVEENETHAVIRAEFPEGGSGEPTCRDGSAPELVGETVGALECLPDPIVLDDVKPTVTLTYPADGEVFEPGSDFVITAEAQDERGITEVELYVNGEPFQKDFEPPYEWDVVGIPEGDYEFGVVARDGPNWAPSEAVNIKVGVEEEPQGTGTTGEPEPATTGADGSTTGEPDGGTGEGDEEGAGVTSDDGGCGCRQSGTDAGALALLGLFGLGFVRRRRLR